MHRGTSFGQCNSDARTFHPLLRMKLCTHRKADTVMLQLNFGLTDCCIRHAQRHVTACGVASLSAWGHVAGPLTLKWVPLHKCCGSACQSCYTLAQCWSLWPFWWPSWEMLYLVTGQSPSPRWQACSGAPREYLIGLLFAFAFSA